MSPAGCPSPQLQPTESSPSGCSGLGSACSWGLSCWHCQPSKQPGHFFSLWYQSLSHGLIPYSFLSPWERPWGLWFFLYICHLICSGSELLCAHNLWVGYLGYHSYTFGIIQWDDSGSCYLGQHRLTKFSWHLRFLQGNLSDMHVQTFLLHTSQYFLELLSSLVPCFGMYRDTVPLLRSLPPPQFYPALQPC